MKKLLIMVIFAMLLYSFAACGTADTAATSPSSEGQHMFNGVDLYTLSSQELLGIVSDWRLTAEERSELGEFLQRTGSTWYNLNREIAGNMPGTAVAVEEAEEAGEAMTYAGRPDVYYTFGDTFIFYGVSGRAGSPPGPLEVTFGAAPTFTVVDYIPEHLLSLRNIELLYGRTFVRIPVTITNLHDDYVNPPFRYLWGTRLILPDGTETFKGGYAGDNPAQSPLDNLVGAIMTVLANRDGIGRVDTSSAGVGAPGETVESYLHIWYTGDRDYVLRTGSLYFVFPITMP